MSYSPDKILPTLQALFPFKTLYVAYSGGCDSQVLLHSLLALQWPGVVIKAIHIDHGLQADSSLWAQQCVEWAEQLGVACLVIRVNAEAAVGQSPEEAARAARYQAFAERLGEGDVLLTAHHCDDQAETLMLQLMRGAGAPGLAAMGACVPFSRGRLARPLLAFTRGELEQYAKAQEVSWIDDPSNASVEFDRNYFRHRVVPTIAQRWPHWQKVVARAAGHQAEVAQIAEDLAALDWQQVRHEANGESLNVNALSALAEYRQRNLLRYWLRQCGLTVPSARQMQHILSDVVRARQDGMPVVAWRGAEVRRYRDSLHAIQSVDEALLSQTWHWDMRQQDSVMLPTGPVAKADLSQLGVDSCWLADVTLSVRYRQGGEKIRIKGKHCHQSLKNLFQEAGLPPWQRGRIPLIYHEDKLLAVVGLWAADLSRG